MDSADGDARAVITALLADDERLAVGYVRSLGHERLVLVALFLAGHAAASLETLAEQNNRPVVELWRDISLDDARDG